MQQSTSRPIGMDYEEMEEEASSAYVMIEHQKVYRCYDVYITSEIGDATQYVPLLQSLRNALPTDTYYIYLNTPGGYIDTGLQLVNAIKNSEARIITVLDGTVCSMGAILFLSANEYIVNDNCRLMFHNYSGGMYGKGNEQLAELKSTSTWYTTLLAEICYPFLTEEELTDVTEGKDLWLDSSEVASRLENVIEYHKALEEEIIKEAQEEEEKQQEKDFQKRLKKYEKEQKTKSPRKSKK